MRFVLRPQPPAEFDPELVWLAVSGVSGAAVTTWLALRLPTPICMFHAITGFPCPTCGATRAVKNLLAGHIGTAFGWNPLVFLALAAIGIFMAYAATVIVFRLPRIRVETITALDSNCLRATAVLVVAANWIYLLYRFSRIT